LTAFFRTPLATTFVAAGVEMGYQNRDGNGEFQTGFMIPQVNNWFYDSTGKQLVL